MKESLPANLDIIDELHDLLNLAHTPVTHRKVAAIIEFEDGTLAEGYNVEKSATEITHAEANALLNTPPNQISL